MGIVGHGGVRRGCHRRPRPQSLRCRPHRWAERKAIEPNDHRGGRPSDSHIWPRRQPPWRWHMNHRAFRCAPSSSQYAERIAHLSIQHAEYLGLTPDEIADATTSTNGDLTLVDIPDTFNNADAWIGALEHGIGSRGLLESLFQSPCHQLVLNLVAGAPTRCRHAGRKLEATPTTNGEHEPWTDPPAFCGGHRDAPSATAEKPVACWPKNLRRTAIDRGC